MKKLNRVQKVIFVLGVLGTVVGIYGKFEGWDSKNAFILVYTGLSFMWIAFLETSNACERRVIKRILRNFKS